ncbi:MAG: 16S rRNA (guanine(527)-N(7))-methyltransferase RsmG, partial [Litoreibacter sp.]|nr:16S rRNA (guanine(527)-N(7))-methyltransferase RsmG [Litoreibacter sp.]
MKPDDAVARISQQQLDVSRETLERLEAYAALLMKWNQKINLVSPAILPELWTRHILDSAQVFKFFPESPKSLCDIGSGGGLPGMILAILAQEKEPELTTTFLESDRRKCAFLQTVAAQLALKTEIRSERIESAEPVGADVVSARALAPLPKYPSWSSWFWRPFSLRFDKCVCKLEE